MINQPKLLIVEDEADLRDSLTEEFSKLDLKVFSVRSGHEAFELVKIDPGIVTILSDIQMPGVDGFECLKKIRDFGFETPFIFLTGFADNDVLRRAMHLGALDVLVKPFIMDDLVWTIEQSIKLGIVVQEMIVEFENCLKKYDISNSDQNRIVELRRKLVSARIDYTTNSLKPAA